MLTLLMSLLLLLLSSTDVSQASVDLTITDKATGSDVVQAVVDLIRQSCIFTDDRLLLRRIAYAETQDGLSAITFKHGSVDFYGGIWQVTAADFKKTKTGTNATIFSQIRAVFGLEWSAVQYADLVKPLYSGLAARLRIHALLVNDALPQNVQDQGAFWANRYTLNYGGNSTDAVSLYVNASASLATGCSTPKADIIFVIDSSASITSANFVLVRSFVQRVVQSFDVAQQKVRVGLVEFSSTVAVQFDLLAYNSSSEVESAVARIPYFNSGTNTAAAIDATLSLVERQGRQRDGVPVIVIVLTDGQSNNQPATLLAAKNFHRNMSQVTVFAVGVGNGVDVTELKAIASQPSCLYVHLLSSFNDVASFTERIMTLACQVPAQLQTGVAVRGYVEYDQYYYFRIIVHQETSGITVKIHPVSGAVQAYFSWKVQNPSPALYDFTTAVDDRLKADGTVAIPWSVVNSNATRHRRSTDQNSMNVTAPLYGAVVGKRQTINEFSIVYADTFSEASAIDATSSAPARCDTFGLSSVGIAVTLCMTLVQKPYACVNAIDV